MNNVPLVHGSSMAQGLDGFVEPISIIDNIFLALCRCGPSIICYRKLLYRWRHDMAQQLTAMWFILYSSNIINYILSVVQEEWKICCIAGRTIISNCIYHSITYCTSRPRFERWVVPVQIAIPWKSHVVACTFQSINRIIHRSLCVAHQSKHFTNPQTCRSRTWIFSSFCSCVYYGDYFFHRYEIWRVTREADDVTWREVAAARIVLHDCSRVCLRDDEWDECRGRKSLLWHCCVHLCKRRLRLMWLIIMTEDHSVCRSCVRHTCSRDRVQHLRQRL